MNYNDVFIAALREDLDDLEQSIKNGDSERSAIFFRCMLRHFRELDSVNQNQFEFLDKYIFNTNN